MESTCACCTATRRASTLFVVLRVWFAPEDLRRGEKLHEQIDRAIQVNDRLLVVLSKHSMQSDWVKLEITKARKAERDGPRRKLFPIALVPYRESRRTEFIPFRRKPTE